MSSSSPSSSSLGFSIDLVAASRRHLSLLSSIPTSFFFSSSPLLSIHRYRSLWLPLLSELSRTSSAPPLLLPPSDVLWIWNCHSQSPSLYRDHCVSAFAVALDRPALFDEETEAYASDRCREIWTERYPSEPFELEEIGGEDWGGGGGGGDGGGELVELVRRYSGLRSHLKDPFLRETVFLISARARYRDFLKLCGRRRREEGSGARLVPTSDIALMWMAHKVRGENWIRIAVQCD